MKKFLFITLVFFLSSCKMFEPDVVDVLSNGRMWAKFKSDVDPDKIDWKEYINAIPTLVGASELTYKFTFIKREEDDIINGSYRPFYYSHVNGGWIDVKNSFNIKYNKKDRCIEEDTSYDLCYLTFWYRDYADCIPQRYEVVKVQKNKVILKYIYTEYDDDDCDNHEFALVLVPDFVAEKIEK